MHYYPLKMLLICILNDINLEFFGLKSSNLEVMFKKKTQHVYCCCTNPDYRNTINEISRCSCYIHACHRFICISETDRLVYFMMKQLRRYIKRCYFFSTLRLLLNCFVKELDFPNLTVVDFDSNKLLWKVLRINNIR